MHESKENYNYTPAEQYQILLSQEEPNYYARIPAILYHCTYLEDVYEEGQYKHTVRKKLSPQALALYGYLKQLTGIKNKSWANRDLLAKMTGMSAGLITKAKNELSQKFEQLNGKSLIRIEKKKHVKFDEKRNQRTSTPYDEIWLENVWSENNAYMGTLKYQEELVLGIVHNSTSMSEYDGVPPPQCQNMTECSQSTMSEYDTNKNQINKKHFDKAIEACADSAPALSLSSSSNLSDESACTGYLSDERDEMIAKLRKTGCDEPFIHYLLKTYTIQEINAAGAQMRKIIESGKTIENYIGYFRRILESSNDRH